MRRYTLTVNDSTKVIEIEAVEANLFRVQIDGRLVDVTLEDHRDLAHSAITPAITPRAVPSAGASSLAAEPARQPSAAALDTTSTTRQASPRPAETGAAAAAGGAGRSKMTAPMPGVILSIDVAAGACVHRGDTVMVLEAMKMKNELKAPRDGRIAEIYVVAGQQVKFGETLIRFEEN